MILYLRVDDDNMIRYKYSHINQQNDMVKLDIDHNKDITTT